MPHSWVVENCEETSQSMVGKGESKRKGRRYCMAGAPNDVCYKSNTHMPGISIHYFPKDVAAWQNGRVSIVDIEEILLFNVVSLMPRTGFEDACNEHIALVKSGEDNQWIQLRRMLIKEPVFTPYTIVQHSFREPLTVVYFTRFRCTDTPCFSTWLHFHFS